MNLIANKLFSKAIESIFCEAGKIYFDNPKELEQIKTTLDRIIFELSYLKDRVQEHDEEYVDILK